MAIKETLEEKADELGTIPDKLQKPIAYFLEVRSLLALLVFSFFLISPRKTRSRLSIHQR